MSSHQSTLSVVMPNYNHAEFIGFALDALSKQSLAPTEVIIIDDASTDDSLDIIKSFQKKHSYISVYQNDYNQGVVYTLNRGLELSTGDYILFSAADDVLFPEFIKRTMEQFSLHPQAGLCSAKTRIIDKDGVDKGPHRNICIRQKAGYISPTEVNKAFTCIGNWVQSNTTVYRRDYLLEEKGFPLKLGSYADSYINMVVALKYGVCFVPEYLGRWRRLETSFSSQNSSNPECFYRIIEETKTHFLSENAALFTKNFIKAWENQMICQFLIDSMECAAYKCKSFIENVVNKEESASRKLVLFLSVHGIRTAEMLLKFTWVLLLKPHYVFYYLKKIFRKEVV